MKLIGWGLVALLAASTARAQGATTHDRPETLGHARRYALRGIVADGSRPGRLPRNHRDRAASAGRPGDELVKGRHRCSASTWWI
jgi:hypothetical protein